MLEGCDQRSWDFEMRYCASFMHAVITSMMEGEEIGLPTGRYLNVGSRLFTNIWNQNKEWYQLSCPVSALYIQFAPLVRPNPLPWTRVPRLTEWPPRWDPINWAMCDAYLSTQDVVRGYANTFLLSPPAETAALQMSIHHFEIQRDFTNNLIDLQEARQFLDDRIRYIVRTDPNTETLIRVFSHMRHFDTLLSKRVFAADALWLKECIGRGNERAPMMYFQEWRYVQYVLGLPIR